MEERGQGGRGNDEKESKKIGIRRGERRKRVLKKEPVHLNQTRMST